MRVARGLIGREDLDALTLMNTRRILILVVIKGVRIRTGYEEENHVGHADPAPQDLRRHVGSN